MPDNAATHFEEVYVNHFARVRGFLCVCLGNNAAVDDLTQETFLHLWSNPDAYDPYRSNLRTYLLGVARKKAADWWRHSSPTADQAIEPQVESESNSLTMRDAVAKLDADLRNVLWLREAEGYSYEELARILDIPVGTVKSRLFTAREHLRMIWRAK